MVVFLKKCSEAISVIIMSVGQHAKINGIQINAHHPGIPGKSTRGAAVQQNLFIPVLNVDRQSPLTEQFIF